MPIKLPYSNWGKLFLVFLGCFIIAGVAAIISLFMLAPRAVTTGSGATILNGDADGIFFLGYIYQVNVQNRTASISWLIGGCGSLRLQTSLNYTGLQCGQANVPLAVYIDNNLQFHYDPTIQPRNPTNDTLFLQDLNQFHYTHPIDINNVKLGNDRMFNQEYFYPFEKYGLTTTFMAVNTADNTSLTILSLSLSDIINYFQPYSNETETQSFINNTLMQSRTVRVHLERTLGTKLYAMLLFSMNWLVTVVVLNIMLVALSALKHDITPGIVALPLTMILTLPNLRKFFPDSPDFGLFLDSLGLIPQMFLVSVSGIGVIAYIYTIKVKPPLDNLNYLKDSIQLDLRKPFNARSVNSYNDADPLLPNVGNFN